MNINLTSKRIMLLQLLYDDGAQYVSNLAHIIAPRKNKWSTQSAARWGGGYVKPLEDAGLVTVNRHVRHGVGVVSITTNGISVVNNH